MVTGEAELKSMLKAEQESSGQLYESFDNRLTAMSGQIDALQAKLVSMEQTAKSKVSNDVIFELLRKVADGLQSAQISSGGGDGGAESANVTSQLVQETKHAIVDAVKELSDRLDNGEQKREATVAKLLEAVESAKVFQDDVRNSFRVVSDELKSLSDVEKVLVQTADSVLDTKRRIEYSAHQILMEVTAVVNDRSKELNESVSSGLNVAVRTLLDAQSAGMANLSVKIETEISQVWRQIGIMYQTLTDSAATLTALQRQTDAFVNGTATSVNGMDNKVTAIAGRMAEVDENLNYLLGRLSLVTQEFREIKIGLGEALESIRVGLQTVQGSNNNASRPTSSADPGPGPNPIDEEPLQPADTVNPNVLSKTVYTVS